MAVDQNIAPTADLEFDDAVWQSLGKFTFVAGTASVVLGENTASRVLADGVRIVQVPPFTQTLYNEAGQVISQTDELGRTTRYEYDDRGRTIREEYPDPDGDGPETAPIMLTTYDLYDRVQSETYVLGVEDSDPSRPSGDADDLTTTYQHDDLHRLIAETDPNGNRYRRSETNLPDIFNPS